MELTELKTLMGIADGDISQDAMLSLYLDAAKEQLYAYATGYKFVDGVPFTGSMKLGIVKYVQLSQKRSQGAIKSKSLDGLSVTYMDAVSGENYYDEAFAYWDVYRNRGLIFKPALRSNPPARCLPYGRMGRL